MTVVATSAAGRLALSPTRLAAMVAGLALLVTLIAVAGLRALAPGAGQPVIMAAFLAALSVFVVGAFGSPLDSSRVSTWFYLLLAVGVLLPKERTARAAG